MKLTVLQAKKQKRKAEREEGCKHLQQLHYHSFALAPLYLLSAVSAALVQAQPSALTVFDSVSSGRKRGDIKPQQPGQKKEKDRPDTLSRRHTVSVLMVDDGALRAVPALSKAVAQTVCQENSQLR